MAGRPYLAVALSGLKEAVKEIIGNCASANGTRNGGGVSLTTQYARQVYITVQSAV